MSRTKINVSAVIEAYRQISSAKTYVSSAKSSFTQTKNSIDSKIKNRSNIGNRLNTVQRQLSNIESKMGRIRSTVQSGANQYRSTDDKVESWKRDINTKIGTRAIPTSIGAWAKYFRTDSDIMDSLKQKNSERDLIDYGFKVSSKDSLKASGKFKNTKDAIEDKLKDKHWLEEDDDTIYYDKDGNEIKEKDAPTFYKKQMTLGEIKKSASASASIYDGTFDIGENGSLSVTVGEAEAHAAVSAGFYVIGADGEKKFSPGVNAEVGVSVTAFEVEWEQQWLGDENFGLNSDLSVTAGKASAQAEVGAQIFGEDGKLDVQLGASASAELIGGEIEGSIGVNVLGGEVGVSGSINYGIGAHADVGYKDGVFKCDVGASLGVGVSFGFEVDVGGMVNTVADTAEAAWDGIKSGWNNFWSGR